MIEKGQTKSQYKLIFMDFSMPEIDGLETSKMIQKFFQEIRMQSEH